MKSKPKMKTPILCISLLSFLISLTAVHLCGGVSRNYTLTTKLLHTLNSSDPDLKDYLNHLHFSELYGGQAILKYVKYIESKPILPKERKSLNNL